MPTQYRLCVCVFLAPEWWHFITRLHSLRRKSDVTRDAGNDDNRPMTYVITDFSLPIDKQRDPTLAYAGHATNVRFRFFTALLPVALP